MSANPPFRYDDGFKQARKPRKKSKGSKRSPRELFDAAMIDLAEEDGGQWIARVERDLGEFVRERQVPMRVLCLGLGSPGNNTNARMQLSLLLRLAALLHIDHADIALYDPVLDSTDHALLHDLGCQTLKEEELHVQDKTLLFMPHCEIELYERVLTANATEFMLGSILLVGNDLRDYVSHRPQHEVSSQFPRITQFADRLETVAINSPDRFAAAFNNTGFQATTRDQDPSAYGKDIITRNGPDGDATIADTEIEQDRL